ncbi:MAG TPA: hypothetical protein VN426_02605 [Syntrophomonadaceae bacterium]|nr:hypothetical protein [Syntrophomonadaceae bacterium]
MFKTCRTFVIGILALGLFLGSSGLINPSIASAATTVNTQPIITYHSVTGSQKITPAPNYGSKQFNQSPYRYNSIVTRAAKLMKVSNQVVINGLNRGNTLVQIAKKHGIYRSSILTQLKTLQKELNYTKVTPTYDIHRRPILNQPAGQWNAPNYGSTKPGFGHNLTK